MEVTKRYSIAYKGLKDGQHDFRFEVGRALFEAFESTEITDGACEVLVALRRSETMLTLDVTITGSVVVACDRCLEDCNIPLDFEGQLLVKFSDQVVDYDGEVLWLSLSESELDLSLYIYESIVLSLPYQRVHPEGVCNPAMLEHFQIVSGEEFGALEAQVESDEQALSGEWSKLAELKRQMEAGEQAEK